MNTFVNIKSRKIPISTVLKVAYLIFLVTTIFYVKSVLDVDSFKATEKAVEKPTVKVKNVSVNLLLEVEQETKEYKAELRNIDTVEDFLKELRNKQGLYYEKDIYTYGVEIVSVFDKEPVGDKKWAVLLDDKNITNKISDEYLVDGAIYTLKQVALVANASSQ
ncbi:MAG: hypothetical protein WC988_00585 [Patescibacteria group bacterium]